MNPLESTVERLYSNRSNTPPQVPIQSEVHEFARRVQHTLFPHFLDHTFQNKDELRTELESLSELACRALSRKGSHDQNHARKVCDDLIQQLPSLQEKLLQDAQFIFEGDPAARSVDDVIAAYPGFQAILHYRVAHFCWQQGLHSFARALTEYGHRTTGIDIHPAATIGSPFFIDHGTGIVIGETTVIGNHVKIYQGVTLGALSVDKSLSETQRHPTIHDNVVIYASATILGGKTEIGEHATIGGNVWLTESVPPHSTVYHRSEIIIHSKPEA
jgi:serine O-acetyltransferase